MALCLFRLLHTLKKRKVVGVGSPPPLLTLSSRQVWEQKWSRCSQAPLPPPIFHRKKRTENFKLFQAVGQLFFITADKSCTHFCTSPPRCIPFLGMAGLMAWFKWYYTTDDFLQSVLFFFLINFLKLKSEWVSIWCIFLKQINNIIPKEVVSLPWSWGLSGSKNPFKEAVISWIVCSNPFFFSCHPVRVPVCSISPSNLNPSSSFSSSSLVRSGPPLRAPALLRALWFSPWINFGGALDRGKKRR